MSQSQQHVMGHVLKSQFSALAVSETGYRMVLQ